MTEEICFSTETNIIIEIVNLLSTRWRARRVDSVGLFCFSNLNNNNQRLWCTVFSGGVGGGNNIRFNSYFTKFTGCIEIRFATKVIYNINKKIFFNLHDNIYKNLVYRFCEKPVCRSTERRGKSRTKRSPVPVFLTSRHYTTLQIFPWKCCYTKSERYRLYGRKSIFFGFRPFNVLSVYSEIARQFRNYSRFPGTRRIIGPIDARGKDETENIMCALLSGRRRGRHNDGIVRCTGRL